MSDTEDLPIEKQLEIEKRKSASAWKRAEAMAKRTGLLESRTAGLQRYVDGLVGLLADCEARRRALEERCRQAEPAVRGMRRARDLEERKRKELVAKLCTILDVAANLPNVRANLWQAFDEALDPYKEGIL